MSKKCPACDKTAYSMEAVKVGGDAFWFHKTCFKCQQCDTPLAKGKELIGKKSNKVLCKKCFDAEQGLTGFRGTSGGPDSHTYVTHK